MFRVFHLYNIIQLIIDRFNQALFLSKILSTILISVFFILFLTSVTSCMPLRKRFLNRDWTIYPLSAHSFPSMFFRSLPCFNGPDHQRFFRGKYEIEELTLVIDYRMQLKFEEPSYVTSSMLGKLFKCHDIHAME